MRTISPKLKRREARTGPGRFLGRLFYFCCCLLHAQKRFLCFFLRLLVSNTRTQTFFLGRLLDTWTQTVLRGETYNNR